MLLARCVMALGVIVLCTGTGVADDAGQWTWLGGVDELPVYGEQGVPDAANTPGPTSFGAYWKDLDGNFWLLPGRVTNDSAHSTLWKYDVSLQAWAWIMGDPDWGVAPNYGEKGVPHADNWVGARRGAAFWTDLQGRFWLYGGLNSARPADMWMYDPTLNVWTWVAGSNIVHGQRVDPVAGGPGEFAEAYTPGSREYAATWVDHDGNLWLLGGAPLSGSQDLWKFDIGLGQWARMQAPPAEPGAVLGELGVPDVENQPGNAYGNMAWTGPDGSLWTFAGAFNGLLWRYTLSDNCWTWMGGVEDSSQPSVYGELGVPSETSWPGARSVGAVWTDNHGDAWLYGGHTFVGEAIKRYGDLWKFDSALEQWAWSGGSQAVDPPVIMGDVGVPHPDNLPGGRMAAQTWTGNDGYFYLYGGQGLGGVSRSDMWRLKPPVFDETSVADWAVY